MTPTPYFNKFQLEYIERVMQGPLRARIAELEAEIERLRPRKSKPTEYLGPNCAR